MSDHALAVFRQFVEENGNLPIDDSNREAYRELAREGLMIPGHSFTRGWNFYALTDAGKKFVTVLERGSFACTKETA
ncbi:hypothetical protein [Aquisphaera insulae]|uniref:hypothetical protein n=1 Tax=Aquisphaera insulae TaxID=2712864 RepID=UPI0013ED79B3|nr:hypothetical protein [Aquisphaera insulae]